MVRRQQRRWLRVEKARDSSAWPEKQFPHTRSGTRRVGRKRPNALGLHDMLGNVYESCEDWLGECAKGPVQNPHGAERGVLRVLRGGAWLSKASNAQFGRAAY